MTVTRFPRSPHRAIVIAPHGGKWRARFAGDEWTAPWTTETGALEQVRSTVARGNLRRGLPIVELGTNRRAAA